MVKKKIFYNFEGKKFPLVMGSRGSSGVDLCSQKSYRLERGGSKLIETGLRVAIPEGYEIQIRPRSGLALKHGITVLNSPGTIDSDYRGEIGVILVNHSNKPFYVTPGDRIAQMVVMKVDTLEFDFVESETLEETERGEGGFGSTKVKTSEEERTEGRLFVSPLSGEQVSEPDSAGPELPKKRGRRPKATEEDTDQE